MHISVIFGFYQKSHKPWYFFHLDIFDELGSNNYLAALLDYCRSALLMVVDIGELYIHFIPYSALALRPISFLDSDY